MVQKHLKPWLAHAERRARLASQAKELKLPFAAYLDAVEACEEGEAANGSNGKKMRSKLRGDGRILWCVVFPRPKAIRALCIAQIGDEGWEVWLAAFRSLEVPGTYDSCLLLGRGTHTSDQSPATQAVRQHEGDHSGSVFQDGFAVGFP